ncbi:hypothetical protein SUGI_0535990 [Cryptomeria japonica]|uniref:uncharacterized protein LOC131054874 n=1 Tax=Cryptomeria japonica TaxID=3369 RepID=UPI002408DAA6|nr:uncharacterized protein LOC131054874 [Cryptomeria japonica]GLJ27308.1 hypothetical protein SUGI_0535990 [Cryptomeria japonica]
MEISSSSAILNFPQIPNALFGTRGSRFGRLSSLGLQGRMCQGHSLPLLSSSSLSIGSQKIKIRVPYAMNTPLEGLSGKFEERKNTPMENLPNKLWDMCPEPVRKYPWKEACERVMKNTQMEDTPAKLREICPEPVKKFPWKKACERVINRLFLLIEDVAKQFGIPILVVTFFMEASYCIAQNKELFIPIALFAGGVFAEVLNETSIELKLPQNYKEGDLPRNVLIIISFFSLIKIIGPFYPYWARIILPHFANGGLCRTIWLAKDYLTKNLSQTIEALNHSGGDSRSDIGAEMADS